MTHAVAEPAKVSEIDAQRVSEGLFETAETLSPVGRKDFSSVGWDSSRHGAVLPAYVSDLHGSESARAEFLRGAEALGLNTERKPIQPQQYVIADVMAGSDSMLAVCIPRRATKTTSILAVAIGRCLERDDYQVAFTAQSGVKARDRFLKDVVVPLERLFPDTDLFKINRSRGGEHIRFANGSLLTVLPPIPDSFRGDSFDLVIADESQEHDPDLSADLLGAILPTFDTRPGAQLVIAGTAGEHRSGLLWDALQNLREGKAGGVGFAAPDITPVHSGEADDPTEGTTADPAIWQATHPGVGNLTPLSAVQRNFDALPHRQFAREYLGIWPQSAGSRLFDIDRWNGYAIAGDLTLPDKFSVTFAVGPFGVASTIGLAWRDAAGVGHVGVSAHRKGSAWVAAEALRISRKYRVPIVYDATKSANQTVADELNRKSPKPRMTPRKWPEVSTAAALFYRDFETGKLRHYTQDVLTETIQIATRSGTYASSRWNYRPPKDGVDISALEACVLALHHFDEISAKGTFGVMHF